MSQPPAHSNDQKASPSVLSDLVLGVDHVAIAVEDLDVAIRWYSEALGFSMQVRRTTQGELTGMTSAVMSSGSAIIVLVCGTSPESQVSKFIEQFGAGVQHMALAVSSLDDAIKKLEAAGGSVDVNVIEGTGIRQVFLRRDPSSGVRVELIERAGGDFSDRSIEQLFREFERRELV